jgi:hypothetical protein
MSYDPQDLEALVPPIQTAGVTSPWRICIANHDELYTLAETPVASWHGEPLVSPVGVEQDMLRFRSARGYDYLVGGQGIQLRVQVIAYSTTAGLGGDLKLYGGASTTSVSVSGTAPALYTLTATPDSSDDIWTLALAPAATKELVIISMVAFWVAATPGTRAYPSGWRQTVVANASTQYPVHTELAARLLNGPVFIARDRPVCVFSHLWPVDVSGGSFSKYGSWAAWGVVGNTEPVIAARGRIPSSDVRTRPYLVDYFLRTSNGTGGTLRIGATDYPVTADTWGSLQVELGPSDVDITASIDACGAGKWAYFETIQVWRMAP